MTMANDEWFDDPEEDAKKAEQENDINGEPKTDEPDEPVQEKEETIIEATVDVPASDTIAITTLHNLRKLLKDKRFMLDNDLNPKTCKKLNIIIGEMMGHGGTPLEGIRTIDGLTIYPCPKHEYAPICKCLKDCELFDGVDNTGVCTAQESRIAGYPRHTHFEALQIEREARREGYQFALYQSAEAKKAQKNLQAFELDGDDVGKKEDNNTEEDF